MREIDLRGNALSTVSQSWTNHSTVETLSVGGNPLLCDCNLHWLDESVEAEVDIIPLSNMCREENLPLPKHCSPVIVNKSPHLIDADESNGAALRCRVSDLSFI